MTDTRIACELAQSAGSLLLKLQRSAAADEIGTSALKDRGDRASQTYLAAQLATRCPSDAVLSEEAADDHRRLTAKRVWIIDPLDGTREFSEGRSDWAVHVALWEEGALVAGAVALPGLDTVLDTSAPRRAWQRPERLRMAVSRSRPTSLVRDLAVELGAELLPMGSAGYKTAAVARGEADLYVHSGGQFEWDSAAPVAVARTVGLFTARIDGSPLEYNNSNPYLPDVVVTNPLIADDVLRRLAPLLKKESR